MQLSLWVLAAVQLLAADVLGASERPTPAVRPFLPRQEAASQVAKPALLAGSSAGDVSKARLLVESAMDAAGALNRARLDSPLRITQGSAYAGRHAKRQQSGGSQPLYQVSPDVAAALALVAEADAFDQASADSQTRRSLQKRDGTFWMEHMGAQANGTASRAFRNVRDFGAKGDGIADDTAAIRSAISGGDASSTEAQNIVVYFPPGTYLISSSIETSHGSQLIGDANDWPTLTAATSFIGLGVISTAVYAEGQDSDASAAFSSTSSAYRQIRNFKIDLTHALMEDIVALHYQVSHATSLSNVEFFLPESADTRKRAIFAETGSGGHMSDLSFHGGAYGIYGGTQQFTVQRLKFDGTRTAVQLIWDWGWVWKSIEISNAEVGFELIAKDWTQGTGSLLVVDSSFKSTKTAILALAAKEGDYSAGITLDNVKFDNVQDGVADTSNRTHLVGSTGSVDTWVYGNLYLDPREKLTALSNSLETAREPSLLASAGSLPKSPFFERTRPQYESTSASQVLRASDFGAKGDGISDDTEALRSLLKASTSDNIVLINAGSYIITDTIDIPNGARVVGQSWPELVAFGPKFGDALQPIPLVRVGEKGEVGTVEIQDLLFTSKGETAGSIFVEWNIQASSPGAAAMWDSHVRVGGTESSDLTKKECSLSSSCQGGSLMMHITPGASAYLENVWLWVADRALDDPSVGVTAAPDTSIYVARGLLVESTAATWIYGLSSEHSALSQIEFNGAKNVHASMIQSETAYQLEGGSELSVTSRETCTGCGESWGVRILNSSDIGIHGAGAFAWGQSGALIQLQENGENVRIQNLVTVGSEAILESDSQIITTQSTADPNNTTSIGQVALFDPLYAVLATTCSWGSDPSIPDGSWGNPSDDTAAAWFTIANGSPYDFVLQSSPSYQMVNWGWDIIPAGESRQFTISFDHSIFHNYKDSAGEAYYSVKGTDKTFYISAKVVSGQSPEWRVRVIFSGIGTQDVTQGSTIDLGFPVAGTQGRGLQWVLTGSESYGYWTSLKPPVTWMKSILPTIGPRKLRHVCMPGSHDAGMSKLDGKTALATASNTQTQWLNIYNQLVRGSRFFDVRPCLGNGGRYMTCHYSQIGTYQGANGEGIANVISEVNSFMNDYPGELVILDINGDSGYDTDNGYPRLTTDQWRPIINTFRDGINKPCANFGNVLGDVTMNQLIGDGNGCVLMVLAGGIADELATPSRGIYPYGSLPFINDYANSDSAQTMGQDQVAKMKTRRVLGQPGASGTQQEFFVLSWTLTIQWTNLLLPLWSHAARAFNSLFWYGYHAMTPFSYPNVLYVDYLGQPNELAQGKTQDVYMQQTTNDVLALAMAVNLELASQNCYVGGGAI
ncbi:pectin lyase-like protein [Thozetella sp. PMI_491]|nr:pectin lyase-like protein [Thozetella sp. PMI_491]